MKIKSIHLKDFKRFKELTISGIPAAATLVVMVGPNGFGKSSVFDAMHESHYLTGVQYPRYYARESSLSYPDLMDNVNIGYHDGTTNRALRFGKGKKNIYVRSAYRNTPSFAIGTLTQVEPALEEIRITRLIDNDQATDKNYRRLVSQTVEGLFDEKRDTHVGEFRERIISEVREALQKLFPDLILNRLGKPLQKDATFDFQKGEIKNFAFENLSSGEKAAFDLILDLIIKRREYNDTVYCIDEPEAHIGVKQQRDLLAVLYGLIPDNCQLWIATHSIGMMRKAHELQRAAPDSVVFLDFDGLDFDEPQRIEPKKVDRAYWERMHAIALDDMAGLVMPDRLYVCESPPEKSVDADCYNAIFAEEFPQFKFISAGGKKEIEKLVAVLSNADIGAIALRDRDDLTDEGLQEKREQGVRVLSRRCLEAYLIDDEVLAAYVEDHLPGDILRQLSEIRAGNEPKPAVAKIWERIKTAGGNPSNPPPIGDNVDDFKKHVLSKLITPEMAVYQELRRDIFGEGE